MPKRNRSTIESAVIDLVRKGSPTGTLLLCAIQRGLTMSEVADRTGISRQAVISWTNGSEAHSHNLKKLIRNLDIDQDEIASVLADISLGAQGYDPESLMVNVVIKRLNTYFQDIHNGESYSSLSEHDRDDDWYFQNGFLKKNLKVLFLLAFRDKSRGFDIEVVRGDSCDAEAWRSFCEEHVDDKTGEISYKSSLRSYFSNLSDVCRNYARIKKELDSICDDLDLAPAFKESKESRVILFDDIRWEDQFEYDRSNQIDYFFYWLSDRDGQEFLNFIFEQIKVHIANNDSELCIFFHDALDRPVIEDFVLDWNHTFFDEEERHADLRIFGDWNSSNKDLDPSKRMKDLGYFSDFINEEWRQDIAEEANWIAFVGTSANRSRSRFVVPKSCTLCAFTELMDSLGYTSKVKALTKLKDIFMLSIRW
jgi:transcriptional regulator with XRE-family HTH domain